MYLYRKQANRKRDLHPQKVFFVALGTAGSSEMARQIGAELNEKGNIRVNEEMEHNGFRTVCGRGLYRRPSSGGKSGT